MPFPFDSQSILNLLPGNVYWKDRQGFYLGCNQSCAQFIGFSSPEDIAGKTIVDIVDFIGVSQIERQMIIDSTKLNDRKVMNGKCDLFFEEETFDHSGNRVVFYTHKSPVLDASGEVVGLVGSSVDITALRKKESVFLEKIIMESPGTVYWKDRGHRYLGCNKNVARLLHMKSPKEMIGKRISAFVDAEVAVMVEQNDEEVMVANREVSFEEKAFDYNGEDAIHFTRKVPIQDEVGDVIGMLGMSMDITELKQKEASLIIAQRQAEQASKAKTDFIMNMSHDIRTPFSGVLGSAQLLEQREVDLDKKEKLGFIVQSSKQLLHLFDEVISLVKQDADTYEEAVQFSISQLLDELNKMLCSEVQLKGIALTSHIDSQVPDLVKGKHFKLKQVLLNLLGNAIKFTEKGSVSVSVETVESDQDIVSLQFVVKDTGIGFSQDLADEVFERFVRLHASCEGKYKGTGIGLWVVKRLVDEMGGKVKVRAEEGRGATFTLTVPFQCCFSNEAECDEAIESEAKLLAPVLNSGHRVLLVEDDRIAGVIARELLRDAYGCKVDIATSGGEALGLMEQSYSLIVVDLGLPDMDGFSLVQQISDGASHNQNAVMIGLTAHLGGEVSERLEASPLVRVLKKPLSVQQLNGVLSSVLTLN